jgi:hypothetical protein
MAIHIMLPQDKALSIGVLQACTFRDHLENLHLGAKSYMEQWMTISSLCNTSCIPKEEELSKM